MASAVDGIGLDPFQGVMSGSFRRSYVFLSNRISVKGIIWLQPPIWGHILDAFRLATAPGSLSRCLTKTGCYRLKGSIMGLQEDQRRGSVRLDGGIP